MHALAVHSDQTKTTDAGRGGLARWGDVKRQSSTYEHRKTSAACSSLAPHNLGRGLRALGHFLADGRGSSLVVANRNSCASLGSSPADRNRSSDNCFRHIAEHLSHSRTSLPNVVSDAPRAIGKDFAGATEPFVGAAKSYD